MEILRIPTHYTTQITYMSNEDKSYIFEVIMRMSIGENIELEKSMRGGIALSIFTEALQLENKANAKKGKSLKIQIAPMVQPMAQPNLKDEAPKSNQNKTKQIKSKQDKTNLSKDKEQSSELVKVDNRDLDIDVIIETMKSFNLGIVDDTIKKQRQYGKLIKDKINKIKGFEKYEGNYNNFITMLYQNSDEYRKNHFRSLEKFYREMANIITGIKIQAEKPVIRKGC